MAGWRLVGMGLGFGFFTYAIDGDNSTGRGRRCRGDLVWDSSRDSIQSSLHTIACMVWIMQLSQRGDSGLVLVHARSGSVRGLESVLLWTLTNKQWMLQLNGSCIVCW